MVTKKMYKQISSVHGSSVLSVINEENPCSDCLLIDLGFSTLILITVLPDWKTVAGFCYLLFRDPVIKVL